MSLAVVGAFGRSFWATVLGGIDTLAETVSATDTFSVTGGLTGAGGVAVFGAGATTLAGGFDVTAATAGQRWP